MTPWTVARQAPLSMEFSKQAYWTRLPFPSPGDLPDAGIEPGSSALQADSLLFESPGKPPLPQGIGLMFATQWSHSMNELYFMAKDLISFLKGGGGAGAYSQEEKQAFSQQGRVWS